MHPQALLEGATRYPLGGDIVSLGAPCFCARFMTHLALSLQDSVLGGIAFGRTPNPQQQSALEGFTYVPKGTVLDKVGNKKKLKTAFTMLKTQEVRNFCV